MHLALCVVVVLFGCPLGQMFVLHPSPEASAVKANRCRELEIRKILLESLNLQQEPRVSVSKMNRLRDQWKSTYKSTTPSSPGGNTTFPEDSGNSTCCKHSSQVFIKDLGWDRWVVYPESITFVQCQPCGVNRCSESPGVSAQCCKPTAHDIVLFLYMDEWSSLVLSSVSLIRECGCDPGEKTQDPEVMTLS
uniref:Gonadal somatic cell derived factor n=1 Tax=Cyprinus carpio TaxID=7962 RepID=A0A8C1PNZ9_CYPCA